MTTVVICAGCAREMERYEDDGPYIERPEGLCSRCIHNEAAFDAALDAYQANQHEDYEPLPERPDPFERTMPLPDPPAGEQRRG